MLLSIVHCRDCKDFWFASVLHALRPCGLGGFWWISSCFGMPLAPPCVFWRSLTIYLASLLFVFSCAFFKVFPWCSIVLSCCILLSRDALEMKKQQTWMGDRSERGSCLDFIDFFLVLGRSPTIYLASLLCECSCSCFKVFPWRSIILPRFILLFLALTCLFSCQLMLRHLQLCRASHSVAGSMVHWPP